MVDHSELLCVLCKNTHFHNIIKVLKVTFCPKYQLTKAKFCEIVSKGGKSPKKQKIINKKKRDTAVTLLKYLFGEELRAKRRSGM